MRAHLLNTGPEFLRQTGGRIDAFADFAGTGGTFAGCAAAFKAFNPDIDCYLVEPEGAAVLAGHASSNPNHKIQGGGYAKQQLPLLNSDHVDGYLQVSSEESILTARRLALEEGLFGGFSTGANVAAALRMLTSSHRGKTIAVLCCDSGLKYLSTDLWKTF